MKIANSVKTKKEITEAIKEGTGFFNVKTRTQYDNTFVGFESEKQAMISDVLKGEYETRNNNSAKVRDYIIYF